MLPLANMFASFAADLFAILKLRQLNIIGPDSEDTNMTQIEAIFQGGVFKPLGEVGLRENQKVRLNIQPLERTDVRTWLEEVQQYQQRIVDQRGYFPDSTSDIATDRVRDE